MAPLGVRWAWCVIFFFVESQSIAVWKKNRTFAAWEHLAVLFMTREEIITIVDNIFVDEFEVDRSVIAPEAPMRESLGLDSLDYVDLVVVIEAQLGVKLTEADFKSVVTFDDFYTTLDQKING